MSLETIFRFGVLVKFFFFYSFFGMMLTIIRRVPLTQHPACRGPSHVHFWLRGEGVIHPTSTTSVYQSKGGLPLKME